MPKQKTKWSERDLVPIVKDWLARMRSEKYKQTTGKLRGPAIDGKGVGNCCLALLCDAMAAKGYGKWRGRSFIPALDRGEHWANEIGNEWQGRLKMFTEMRYPGTQWVRKVESIHATGIQLNDLEGEVLVPEEELFWGDDGETIKGANIPVPFPLIADEAERYYKTIGVL